MFGPPLKTQSPGQIVKLEVPLTVSILLLVSVIVLTIIFVWKPTWRPGIEFLGAATGVAAGILSAYYIGRGLKITIEQRDKALIDERIARAFGLAQRWNEPSFAQVREHWRSLVDEIDEQNANEVCAILEDMHKKTVAADVLNFFEELAYAARSGVAEMETLKNIHRSIVVRYYSVISPWIDKIRRDGPQPTAYEHFEWLRNQWK
jgi:Domain of unknown function (DUF4760)